MNHRIAINLLIISMLAMCSRTLLAQVPPIDVQLKSLPIINYQPFSGRPAEQLLRVEFVVIPDPSADELDSEKGIKPRRVSLRIRPSQLGPFVASGESGQIPIRVRPTQEKGKFDFFDNEYRHDFTVTPFSNEIETISYQVYVNSGVFAVAGRYKLPLYVGIVDSLTQEPLTDLLSVNVDVVVEPKLQINIAGTRTAKGPGGKIPKIDFGELETGENRRVFIQLRGNAPATILVSSENSGVLKGSEPETSVNYSVVVDKVRSELDKPLKLSRPVTKSLKGASYPMQVIVGDVNGAFAGVYEDMITVEVMPQ